METCGTENLVIACACSGFREQRPFHDFAVVVDQRGWFPSPIVRSRIALGFSSMFLCVEASLGGALRSGSRTASENQQRRRRDVDVTDQPHRSARPRCV